MISDTHKFTWIHIPKCGGVSMHWILHKYLSENSNHHNLDYAVSQYPRCENYFKFTFVRNPWSRILSLYFFWKNQHKDHEYYIYDKDEVDYIHENNLSFKDFANKIKDNTRVLLGKPHAQSYCDFYKILNGDFKFDFIGKVENLQNDFKSVCEKIGIPYEEIPHKNKSPHKHYTEYYDNETMEIVAEIYANDIEYFGYKFGE